MTTDQEIRNNVLYESEDDVLTADKNNTYKIWELAPGVLLDLSVVVFTSTS